MPFKKGFPAVSERKNVPKYLEKWISFLIFAIANDFNARLLVSYDALFTVGKPRITGQKKRGKRTRTRVFFKKFD